MKHTLFITISLALAGTASGCAAADYGAQMDQMERERQKKFPADSDLQP